VKINTSKLAALILGGFALLWALALFVGLPFIYSKKIDALIGQPLLTVKEQLGAPTHEWEPAQFRCEAALPCTGQSLGGPVLLYAERTQGWYLYFDSGNVLRSLEKSPPGR
jgi:hypothetical protein